MEDQNITITYLDVNILEEALKEGARTVVIAILPVAVDFLTQWKWDWRIIITVAGLAALRIVDKYMHLQGKEDGNSALKGGLTRF